MSRCVIAACLPQEAQHWMCHRWLQDKDTQGATCQH